MVLVKEFVVLRILMVTLISNVTVTEKVRVNVAIMAYIIIIIMCRLLVW